MEKVFYFFLILLVICNCTTPYQSMGVRGGYDETRLGENIFSVGFRGNAYTSRERAVDFCLLRCAEVALNHGYSHFIIADSQEYTETSSYTTPTTTKTSSYVSRYGSNAYVTSKSRTTGGKTYKYSKPRTKNTIICFEEDPQIDGIIYNAQYVYDSITKKYRVVR